MLFVLCSPLPSKQTKGECRNAVGLDYFDPAAGRWRGLPRSWSRDLRSSWIGFVHPADLCRPLTVPGAVALSVVRPVIEGCIGWNVSSVVALVGNLVIDRNANLMEVDGLPASAV